MGVVMRSARRDALRPGPVLLPLERAGEAGTEVVGAKAANLGRSIAAGLPVLPGFVITTAAVAGLSAGWESVPQITDELAAAWAHLSDGGRLPVVVRSSSPVEDQAASSMAGRFTSIVDVRSWAAFRAAVETVARSAHHVASPGYGDSGSASGNGGGSGGGGGGGEDGRDEYGDSGDSGDGGPVPAPMAVLVQPHLEPRLSGVLFGVDPLSGRTDRRVVAAVEGGPQRLVSGEVDGTRYVLGARGRLRDVDGEPLPLGPRDRRALAALSRRAAAAFGGPQDVEWARTEPGTFWLLQTRPVTAVAERSGAADGPRFGPGPVAETFPDPLGPLEEDLWVPPLRRALAESLGLTGAASRRRLESSPVLISVEGRVAADLDATGVAAGPATLWSRLDPRPPIRRLRAAWTVGRLRAALPGLAADVTAAVDAELTAVGPLGALTDDDLLLLLRRAGEALTAVHGYEMLAGLLPASPLTAASLALEALRAGRAEDLRDDEIVARWPEVLALSAPAVTGSPRLPGATPPAIAGTAVDQAAVAAPAAPSAPAPAVRPLHELGPREALRLRARWLHELTARVALELGRRLADRRLLEGPGDAGLLTLAELEAAVRSGTAPPDVDGRRLRLSPPLPAAFHLVGGRVRATETPIGTTGARGASAGRAAGPTYQGPLPAPAGSVLVVATLDPGLAPYLGGLAGLVAETGNALSHLAILAREHELACVVGCAGALERFPTGTVVALDGTTGQVSVLEGATP